jgi:hypothetical protein
MPLKMYHGVMKKRKEREAKQAEEERLSGVVSGKNNAAKAKASKGRGRSKKRVRA